MPVEVPRKKALASSIERSELLSGIHIECKRAERLQPYDWMAQAERDAARFQDGSPAVFFRRSHSPWLVVMKLEDWMDLYKPPNPTG